MAKNQKVAAGKSPELTTAISKSKQTGSVVETLAAMADIEAAEGAKYENFRCNHWSKVFRDNADDVPGLEGYPKLVRQAKARLLGLDMNKRQSEWSKTDQKLYTVFCANHISPLIMFLELAIGRGGKPGIGVPKVLEFLEGAGTLPQKIAAGRKLLAETIGTVVQKRGTKVQNAETLEAAAQATQATSASGNKLELDKLRPAEASIRLVQSALTPNDVIVTIQAGVNRLKASKEPAEVELGEKIMMAIEEYFIAIGDKNEETEQEQPKGKKKAA